MPRSRKNGNKPLSFVKKYRFSIGAVIGALILGTLLGAALFGILSYHSGSDDLPAYISPDAVPTTQSTAPKDIGGEIAPADGVAKPVEPLVENPPAEKASPAILSLESPKETWRQYANPYRPSDRPMIAIVLDDVGVAKQHAEEANTLPAFVTLALMTYADGIDEFAKRARASGHELLVHMPMEPVDSHLDAGKNALKADLSDEEIKERIKWGLDRFQGYIGVNNHMGSRFTQDSPKMKLLLEELKARGLIFLDSKTIGGSVGDKIAAEMDMPHLARDVFIDNDINSKLVYQQLKTTEGIAMRQGYAIAIGHPHPETIAALRTWIVEAQEQGFDLVPLSYVLCKKRGCE